jgi:hypothetical protein
MICGNIDLDLLSLFPQKDARIMGRMGREGKLFKVNNGGERNERANIQMRKKGLYIAPARNLTFTGTLTWKFRPWGQNFRPPYKISGPNFRPPYRGLHHKRLSGISQGQKLWNFRPP